MADIGDYGTTGQRTEKHTQPEVPRGVSQLAGSGGRGGSHSEEAAIQGKVRGKGSAHLLLEFAGGSGEQEWRLSGGGASWANRGLTLLSSVNHEPCPTGLL